MEVEAGAILADVQNAAKEAGRLFPLSLASEGSARIGGLLRGWCKCAALWKRT